MMCDHLDKQTSFFSILQKHDHIFHANKKVEFLNILTDMML